MLKVGLFTLRPIWSLVSAPDWNRFKDEEKKSLKLSVQRGRGMSAWVIPENTDPRCVCEEAADIEKAQVKMC